MSIIDQCKTNLDKIDDELTRVEALLHHIENLKQIEPLLSQLTLVAAGMACLELNKEPADSYNDHERTAAIVAMLQRLVRTQRDTQLDGEALFDLLAWRVLTSA